MPTVPNLNSGTNITGAEVDATNDEMILWDADAGKAKPITVDELATALSEDANPDVLVTGDIGSTVQGYDAGLAYLDGLDFTNEATFKAGVNLEIGTDVQAYDAGLAAIAALAVTDGNIIVGNGSTWVAESGATARTSLGVAIGSDVQAFGDVLDDLNSLGAAASDGEIIVATGAGAFAYESGATARTSLGVAIGSDVQAFGAVLDDFNTLGAASADGEFIVATGAGAFAYESGATARTSMGVGTGDSPQFTGLTLTGQGLFADGTVGAPGLAFSGDTDTGFYRNGTTVVWSQAGTARWVFGNGNFYPAVDDSYDAGAPSFRYDDVYATNATIQTCDGDEKAGARRLSDTEMACASDIAREAFRAFKWNKAVAKKGEDARVHIGPIAQVVEDVFKRHGLDPWAYGILCKSEGAPIGVRRQELTDFICVGQQALLDALIRG